MKKSSSDNNFLKMVENAEKAQIEPEDSPRRMYVSERDI